MLADPASGSSLTELCQTVIADNQALVLRGQMLIRVANQDQFEARIHIVPAPDAGPVALIFVFTDISEELRKERQIAFQAFHDPLTKLGNRSLLARDLPIALARSQQQGNRLAVLCLDLDNFKNINDALGHATGDLLLLQLAERLRQLVPDPAWVTRHGGDEFIVVCPGLSALDTALALSQTLLSGIAQPFFIKGQVLRITSSIGISLFPDHAQEVGPLISHADLAMYEAKRHGKNVFWVYDKHLFQVSAARLSMENGLRTALQEREVSLAF